MILKTKRLILRPPKKSDWGDIVEGCNDWETARYTSNIPYPYKRKDALEWIKICQGNWGKKKNYSFFIELKKEKKVIGGIDINEINHEHGKCGTGSWINKKYRRKGYITEAKIAINEFAFNKLKLRKMETGAFSFNKASNATQKAVGYKYEGKRIKTLISKATGKACDEYLYGLLKKDWKKQLPNLKKKLAQKIIRLERKKN